MNNSAGRESSTLPHVRYATSHSSTSTLCSAEGVSTAFQNQSGIMPSSQGAEALQMEVDVAERRVDRRQPLEVVADRELVRHPHTAVQLHRVLADEPPRLAYLNLERRDGALRIASIAFVESHRCHVHQRFRLLVFHEHVDHSVLQHLEFADRLAELHARLRVLDGGLVQHFHCADSLCPDCRCAFIDDALQYGESVV